MPTREIGVVMGITKNAVIGKAHRLGLPPRPHAIQSRRPVPARGVGIVPGVLVASSAVLTPVRAMPLPRPPRTCCWPFGEPGTPSFRFCEADAQPGRPYCAVHRAIATQPTSARQDAAA